MIDKLPVVLKDCLQYSDYSQIKGIEQTKLGIFSKWRKIEVVKWAEDAIYAPIQTTDDKNRSLR